MRREALPVLAWAAWLTVLAAVLWAWTDDPLPPGVFGAAAAATWLLGIGLAARPRPALRRRPLADLSLAVLAAAVGVVFLVNSVLLGLWLALVGGGILLLGLAGIARELRVARRVR